MDKMFDWDWIVCRRNGAEKVPKKSPWGPRWIQDKAVFWCKNCETDFSTLVRRHHCRHCGNVFCGHCSKNKRTLYKFGYAEDVRVCNKCNAKCGASEQLVEAVKKGNINTVRTLCEEGVDVGFTTDHFPALTIACMSGMPEVVKLLLKAGADPNAATGKEAEETVASTEEVFGITALHMAVQRKGDIFVECVELLIEAKAEVDPKTNQGNTPLMYATLGGHYSVSKVLVGHGASVTEQSEEDGESPLHTAVGEGHIKLVQLFVDAGADVSQPNHKGETPMQMADRLRRADMISIMLGEKGVGKVSEAKKLGFE